MLGNSWGNWIFINRQICSYILYILMHTNTHINSQQLFQKHSRLSCHSTDYKYPEQLKVMQLYMNSRWKKSNSHDCTFILNLLQLLSLLGHKLTLSIFLLKFLHFLISLRTFTWTESPNQSIVTFTPTKTATSFKASTTQLTNTLLKLLNLQKIS